MPYVGNKGSIAGFVNQPSKQDLTGATGGTLTLTHAVSGPEDISLFINNVRQEPTESYTVTGTTVTLQGYTVAATDDIYVLYNGLTQLSSVPVDGSVSTAKIADDAVTKAKIGTTELDLATIKDSTGTTTAMTIDSSGRILTPARPVFRATGPSPSNVTNQNYSTVTKLTFWDNEVFDVGSNFDSSTDYDFTAPVTGYYQINANVTLRDLTGGFVKMYLYKNGSIYTGAFSENEAEGTEDRFTLVLNEVVQLNATDTIDVRIDTSSDTSLDFVANESSFSGFLIG